MREAAFVGIFLIIALYHLLVFAARAQDNLTALYFGLFCLMLALRDVTNGQMIATMLAPRLPLEVQLSLDYAAAVSLGVWFLLYLAGLFPEFRGRWLQGFVVVYGPADWVPDASAHLWGDTTGVGCFGFSHARLYDHRQREGVCAPAREYWRGASRGGDSGVDVTR